jgi:hypothetical protein
MNKNMTLQITKDLEEYRKKFMVIVRELCVYVMVDNKGF